MEKIRISYKLGRCNIVPDVLIRTTSGEPYKSRYIVTGDDESASFFAGHFRDPLEEWASKENPQKQICSKGYLDGGVTMHGTNGRVQFIADFLYDFHQTACAAFGELLKQEAEKSGLHVTEVKTQGQNIHSYWRTHE